VAWVLGGFLVMFFVQRFFHFHHHEVPEQRSRPDDPRQESVHPDSAGHDHLRHADHEHALQHSAHQLSWVGAAAGLTLHTLINGVALAASVQAEAKGQVAGSFSLAGLGTFLVIILHKPFDALIIGTLMAAGGWSRPARQLVNILFALAIPAGVLLFHLTATRFTGEPDLLVGAALAFAAGTFLCIASSDLLPELQFHAHDRVKLSAALTTGLILAIVVGQIEHHGHEESISPNVIEGRSP
jgi:zinc and cadmium transporter